MTTRNALTSDPILPTIWRLSLPNMVAMVATAGVSIAETTYIGRLGTLELAGTAHLALVALGGLALVS